MGWPHRWKWKCLVCPRMGRKWTSHSIATRQGNEHTEGHDKRGAFEMVMRSDEVVMEKEGAE